MSELIFKQSGEHNSIELGENITLAGWIKGNGNRIVIGAALAPQKIWIQMRGDGNLVQIGAQPVLNGLRVEFGNARHATWGGSLVIGDRFSIASHGRFLLPNPKNRVHIGAECMFSNDIVIRGGEYPHLIFEKSTGRYLDVSEGVSIGDHVWIGEGAYINKAVTIPADCIVSARAVVAKRFTEPNVVIAGNPARVLKRNIEWFASEAKLIPGSPQRVSLDQVRGNRADNRPTAASSRSLMRPSPDRTSKNVTSSAVRTGSPSSAPIILFASYPKTGSTWLRKLIRGMVAPHTSADQAIPSFLKEVPTSAPEYPVMGGVHRIFKTHLHPAHVTMALLKEPVAAVISIYRHPLDILLSSLNYSYVKGHTKSFLNGEIKAVEQIIADGEMQHYIDEFIENDGYPSYATMSGPFSTYQPSWREFASDIPLFEVCYEEMHANPERTVRDLASFLKLDISAIDIKYMLTRADIATKSDGQFYWSRRAYNFMSRLPEIQSSSFIARYAGPIAALGYGVAETNAAGVSDVSS